MRVNSAMAIAVAMFAIGSVFTFWITESNVRFPFGIKDRIFNEGFLAPRGAIDSDNVQVFSDKFEILNPFPM